MNIRLIVAYEGTNYWGWQKTTAGSTIESELERVLEQVLQEKVLLQAASRTDRGVHALGQVVNFHTQPGRELKKLQISLNALLPKDIVVRQIEEAAPGFHPTLDVKSKTYTYEICQGTVQLPRHRLYSWHYHYPLDLEAIQGAIPYLIGTHDFSAFCNQKENELYENHIRTLYQIEMEIVEDKRLKFSISGNHFLYKMVRNLVGTLTYIGSGKLAADSIPEILAHKDRTLAGVTAPACGLTLAQVLY